jgi:hypothetical protein
MCEEGDIAKPIIIGMIQPPLPTTHHSLLNNDAVRSQVQATGIELDGGKLVLRAEKEIVLHCGESSITLTRAGKVLIRGAYLLSRASGLNRIKGGSVHIN